MLLLSVTLLESSTTKGCSVSLILHLFSLHLLICYFYLNVMLRSC